MALWENNDELIALMIKQSLQDFEDFATDSQVNRDAAEIAQNSITKGTRDGHMR